MKKLNRESACTPLPPSFKNTCPCTIRPPPFLIFQIPPPHWEVIKIHFPVPLPLFKKKRGGGGGEAVLNYAKHIVNQFVLLHLRVLITLHLFWSCWDITIHHKRDDATFTEHVSSLEICAAWRQNKEKVGNTNWYN